MATTGILAVIPSYRPDPRLVALAAELAAQCPVIVVDDASPVTADRVLRDASRIPGVDVIRMGVNAGIARSLNIGLRAARDAGATWLLTVDQDSSIPADYVATVLACADIAGARERIAAIGAGVVVDASGPMSFPTRVEHGVTLTDELIQTGTLWSVEALEGIGGFDESLGIDGVDAAACVRLRAAGFALALAPEARITHELGAARSVRVLGRTVLATGHSPERRTSMVRNRLRLLPEEFAVSPAQGARSLRRLAMNTALAVTVEDDRWAKAKGSLRGLLPRRHQ